MGAAIMLDDTSPEQCVEILVNFSAGGLGKTVWVNVDGVCRYRITCVKVPIIVEDNTKE
jgi:hypothetical protein